MLLQCWRRDEQHNPPAVRLEGIAPTLPLAGGSTLANFLTRAANETGANLTLTIGGLLPSQNPARGRRAKGRGESVARNVEWFYRVHVQEPAESIASLAKHYSREVNRANDARSVVQTGIARAKALLDQAEYIYTPLPK